MTDAEREALVERMAEANYNARRHAGDKTWAEYCADKIAQEWGVPHHRKLALAALSVAERVVREDERKMCISDLREMAGYEADETASKAMTGAAFVLELTRARGAA